MSRDGILTVSLTFVNFDCVFRIVDLVRKEI
jgi:hypothetical protein